MSSDPADPGVSSDPADPGAPSAPADPGVSSAPADSGAPSAPADSGAPSAPAVSSGTPAKRFGWWPKSLLWLASHPLITLGGVVFGVVGVVLTILIARDPEMFLADKRKDLGVSGDLGVASITPTEAACGKAVTDLSKRFQDGIARQRREDPSMGPIPKGEFCIVKVRVRNQSNQTLVVPRVGAQLHIGGDEYDYVAIDGADQVLTIFPNEATQAQYIFDIPSRSTPTEVRFKLADADDEVVYRWPA